MREKKEEIEAQHNLIDKSRHTNINSIFISNNIIAYFRLYRNIRFLLLRRTKRTQVLLSPFIKQQQQQQQA